MKDDSTPTLADIDARQSSMRAQFEMFAQGQTDFQIEVFIGNQEGPPDLFPAHTYRHLLTQIKPLLAETRRLLIEKERTKREIQRLSGKMNGATTTEEVEREGWDLDMLELEYKLDDIELGLLGKQHTLSTYDNLLSALERKHGTLTIEDFNREEPDYWTFRLSSQMADSADGAISGYGAGNISSIRRAIQGSLIPDSPNRIDPPNMELQSLRKRVDQVTRRQLGQN